MYKLWCRWHYRCNLQLDPEMAVYVFNKHGCIACQCTGMDLNLSHLLNVTHTHTHTHHVKSIMAPVSCAASCSLLWYYVCPVARIHTDSQSSSPLVIRILFSPICCQRATDCTHTNEHTHTYTHNMHVVLRALRVHWCYKVEMSFTCVCAADQCPNWVIWCYHFNWF